MDGEEEEEEVVEESELDENRETKRGREGERERGIGGGRVKEGKRWREWDR